MPVIIEIRQGDITEADTEAIVNAANNHLWMGVGVAGAIKKRGGQVIEDEAIAKGPIDVGQAVATGAGNLPHKFIIHAAGMGQDLQTNERIVGEVTRNSILLADKLKVKSIAFPAIGTGVGGFPIDVCADAMIQSARELEGALTHVERIVFVLFDRGSFEVFDKAAKR
ncbi:MAG: macro domain-containing protein [candidate division Zixibacteria bacterium]|nr:macro domain-containing protein [candidate division Zixibacteria bacterium]